MNGLVVFRNPRSAVPLSHDVFRRFEQIRVDEAREFWVAVKPDVQS